MSLSGTYPRLARSLKFKIASELASRTLRLALILLAARWLSVAQFGELSFALTIGLLLIPLTDCGLQIFLTRELAAGSRAPGEILAEVLRFKVVLGLFAFILVISGAVLRGGGTESVVVLILFSGSILLGSFVEFCNYVFRGFQRFEFEALLNFSSALLTFLIGGAILLLNGGLAALALGFFLSAVVSLGFAGYLVHRSFIPAADWTPKGPRRVLEVLRPVLPIGLSMLFSMLYFRVDILFIEHFLGNEEVGVYAAAFRIIDASLVLPALILAVLFPAFSELLAQGSSEWPKLLRDTLFGLLLAGLIGVAVLAVFPSQIIGLLFGASFSRSAEILQLLAPGLVLLYLNYALTHFLISLGKQRYNAWLTAACLALNCVLNAVCIPVWGLKAAALSTLATELLLFCLAFPLVLSSLKSRRP